jgi:hypothetical protein
MKARSGRQQRIPSESRRSRSPGSTAEQLSRAQQERATSAIVAAEIQMQEGWPPLRIEPRQHYVARPLPRAEGTGPLPPQLRAQKSVEKRWQYRD